MELGKSAIYMLVVMMSINVGSVMLKEVGITGIPMEALNDDNIIAAYNATDSVSSFAGPDANFYDIGQGLSKWWYRTIPLIEAFPQLMQLYGVPAFIYNPLHNIWRFMWMTFVTLIVIAGRTF